MDGHQDMETTTSEGERNLKELGACKWEELDHLHPRDREERAMKLQVQQQVFEINLIYGVLEAVLENSNLRKARKMPWATTAPLVYSRSAKLHPCQRILQAFLNN